MYIFTSIRDEHDDGEQKYDVEKYWVHHQYDVKKTVPVHDIALIKLKKPVQLSKNVGIACLPKKNEKVPPNSECWIAGKRI